MSRFPVDDSLGSLGAKQWVLLLVSFMASLAVFALLMSTHGFISDLSVFALVIAALPMRIYAQNRRGRIVGIIFLVLVCGYLIYAGWHEDGWALLYKRLTVVAFIVICFWLYALTSATHQANHEIVKRLDVIERRIKLLHREEP